MAVGIGVTNVKIKYAEMVGWNVACQINVQNKRNNNSENGGGKNSSSNANQTSHSNK